MTNQNFKELWGAGSEDSIRLLVSRIMDRVRKTYGPEAVEACSEDLIKISFNDSWINIECNAGEFWIHAPVDIDELQPAKWNKTLEDFHTKIIEPIKDQIGGVATGIGFKQK